MAADFDMNGMDTDEFGLETRSVVLNFLGLLPTTASCVNTPESAPAGVIRTLHTQMAFDQMSPPSPTIRKEVEIDNIGDVTLLAGDQPHVESEFDAKDIQCDGHNTEDEDEIDCGGGNSAVRPNSISLRKTNRPLRRWDSQQQHEDSGRRRAMDKADSGAGGDDGGQDLGPYCRQGSNTSCGSDGSETSSLYASGISVWSSSSGYVDVQRADVPDLVKNKALPAVALPLSKALSLEKEKLDKDVEKAVKKGHKGSPSIFSRESSDMSSVRSPESEVAWMLSRIGDEIAMEYANKLDNATKIVITKPKENITYDLMKQVAEELLATVPDGLKKAALVLLFSKSIVLAMMSMGDTEVGRLVGYTTRLLEDTTADYILSRGGWSSITALEMSPGDSPVDVSSSDGSTPVIPVTYLPEEHSKADSGFSQDTESSPSQASGMVTESSLDSLMTLPSSTAQTPLDPLSTLCPSGGHDVTDSHTDRSQTDKKQDISKDAAKTVASQYLRQFSKEMTEDAQSKRSRNFLVDTTLIVVSCALVGIAAIVLYRGLRR